MAGKVTRVLNDMAHAKAVGERIAKFDEAIALVYDDLRRCAHNILAVEGTHTLQATGLVHEAYVRMRSMRMTFRDRQHFTRMGARTLRRLVVERARAIKAAKRGGGQPLETFHEELPLAYVLEAERIIDLERALAALAPDDVRLIELKFHAQFTIEEMAEILDVSAATVKVRWTRIAEHLARLLKEWDDERRH